MVADMDGDDPGRLVVTAAAVAAIAGCVWMIRRLAGRLRAGLPPVSPRPHVPVPWEGRDVAAVLALVLGTRLVASAGLDRGSSIHALLVANTLAMLAGTALAVGFLRAKGASWQALGWPRPRPAEDATLAAGGLLLVLAPLLAAAMLLDLVVPYSHPIVEYLAAHRDPVAVGLVVLSAVVVAPVAEEFFFRRVLQGWLETKEPPLDRGAAVGLSALAFALAHYGQGLAWLPLFAFGLVLGTLVRQTGSLVPAVLLHAMFNAVSVGLLLLQARPEGTAG
jgi:membrane protease YdiL (CAAX protease family)